MDDNEILISTDDAALLRTLVDQDALGAGEAADALADSLDVARIIQAAQLPRDIVSLGAAVRYAELPAGRERDVVLVHPSDAAPSDGRISVLSPVGRSLLGRKAGSVCETALPNGNRLRIEIRNVRLQAQNS